jgi:hypothetical protein
VERLEWLVIVGRLATLGGMEVCGKFRPNGIQSPDLPARSQSLYQLRSPVPHIITRCLLTDISFRDQTDRSTQNAVHSFILYMFRPVVSAIFRINDNVNSKAYRGVWVGRIAQSV